MQTKEQQTGLGMRLVSLLCLSHTIIMFTVQWSWPACNLWVQGCHW